MPSLASLLLRWLIPCLIPGLVLAAPSSFQEAKRLAETIHRDAPWEFYCGCQIQWNASGSDAPDLPSCNYRIRKDSTRANRIEWEHVVPAADFGRQRPCWRQGGRKQCEASDPVFAAMEADLHNLQPSIGEVNADRSDFQYGMVSGGAGAYGACPTKVDFNADLAEPRDAVKGDAARIHFYMADHYQLRLSRQQQQLFLAWDRQDPVDAWERERDRRIARLMGHHNPFVTGEKRWQLDVRPQSQPVTAAPEAPQRSVPPPTANGPIHANKNSRIYHLPGCPSYNAMAEQNRVMFDSAHAAEQAGYRLANNCRT